MEKPRPKEKQSLGKSVYVDTNNEMFNLTETLHEC